MLQKLGFNAKLNVVNGATYFTTLGNLKTPKLNTGWSDWYQDFPHPNDFFQPLLNGASIHPTNNNNYAQLNDAKLNKTMDSLAQKQLTPSVENQYAALDKSTMEQAPWAPYGNRELSLFTSDRVNFDGFIWSPVFDQDYSSFAAQVAGRRMPTGDLGERGRPAPLSFPDKLQEVAFRVR